jgi:hypothetical protein
MKCLQSLLEKKKANSVGDDFRRRALLLQLFSPFLSKCVRFLSLMPISYGSVLC